MKPRDMLEAIREIYPKAYCHFSVGIYAVVTGVVSKPLAISLDRRHAIEKAYHDVVAIKTENRGGAGS